MQWADDGKRSIQQAIKTKEGTNTTEVTRIGARCRTHTQARDHYMFTIIFNMIQSDSLNMLT